MGDINLLDRINRLAKKIGNAITSSDKASKSAFGIVKIGDNINVSSGKISVPDATESTKGVVSLAGLGGFTVDEIWSGSVTSDYVNITSALLHPITDYKFLIVSWKSGVNVNGGQLLYVPNMSTDTNNSNYLQFGTNNCNIRLGTDTVSIGGGNYSGIKLLGIK